MNITDRHTETQIKGIPVTQNTGQQEITDVPTVGQYLGQTPEQCQPQS